ncbi:SDR family oxidoreductase [Candidatus Parcubacteria bacterium]|nr:SDR family oxidoreductase [Candidatus Parcubacteria bacterium]
MNILIIGSAGQVGGALADILKRNKNFKVIAADKVISKGRVFLDITDRKQALRFIDKVKPSVIILPAAITNVDFCEDQQRVAYKVNVKGVKNIVQAAKKNLSKFIYISTAYVFNGRKGNYKENDKPCPINYYAQTKLEAERIVQNELNDYLIIRTNWVFDLGYDQKNFIVRLLNALKNEELVKVPNDQYGNPTLARNIAWATEELIKKNKKGIYHIVGRDKMSKYQWALKTARYFNLDPRLVTPVSTNNLKQRAMRPKKDDLNIYKAQKELKTKMFSLNESLNFFKARNRKIY